MNSEEQILVRCSSNHVCRSQESPVQDRSIAKEVRAGQLNRDNEENNPFRQGLRSAELGDLKSKQKLALRFRNGGKAPGNHVATSASAG